MALCVVLTMSITPVVAPKSKTIHHGSRKCSLVKEARETYTAYKLRSDKKYGKCAL
uniref:Uncharacterized protein n=1 Tax=Magallana gigas TaxID=29159 RepID=K1RMC6_MAGGI